MAAPSTEQTEATKASSSTSSSPGPSPVIIDLGKHRRKQIRRLRRGEGKLMDDVNETLEEMRTAGTLSPASQPVVIIVQQKRRKLKSLLPLL